MSNARTTSLHEKLPVELRQQVERDLVEQPPGRETYARVYAHHRLRDYGVSLKAVERYGGYLRALHRNQWIRDFGDVLVGEDLSPKIEGLIRTRLYEALVAGEVDINDLHRAAGAEKSLREARIKQEAEKRAAEKYERERQEAMQAVQATGISDEERVRRIREVYGLS